jgi:pimeloyl-ACP methyl ester carboxylesterase
MRRTLQQIDMFGSLSANFAVMVANSSKRNSHNNNNSNDNRRHVGEGRMMGGGSDPIVHKAAELDAWVAEMTTLHLCLTDAIEDYRYHAYKQADSAGDRGGLGIGNGSRGSSSSRGGSSSGGGHGCSGSSKNLERGATFTVANFLSVQGWCRIADKLSDKAFASVGICGEKPIAKGEINEVLNPAIVVRDSFGSLLEHAGNLLDQLSVSQGGRGGATASMSNSCGSSSSHSTPPRQQQGRARAPSTGGSPGINNEVAGLVASISMVFRYAEQLRNALRYMLVQSEHDDEKRKAMMDRISPPGVSGQPQQQQGQTDGGGLDSLLESGQQGNSSSSSSSASLINSISNMASGSQLLGGLLSMNQGPRGPANLSFGLMRAHLTNRCRGYRFRVRGCDDNSIDCIYMPASGFQSQSGQGSAGTGDDDDDGDNGGNGSESDDDGGSCSDDGDRESNDAAAAEHGNRLGSALGGGGGSKRRASTGSTKTSTNDSSSSRSRASSGYSATKPRPSAVGTVLFCGPNAGMYESFSMASPEASWLGYYTRLGLDVVFFNYRGYNLSSGRPSPEGLQNDGIFVLEHLKRELGVRKVLIHGESIGGMVATAVARHFDCSLGLPEDDGGSGTGSIGSLHTPPASSANLGDVELGGGSSGGKGKGAQQQEDQRFRIKMLVCDRTFASLDAVAARFLGVWAAYGLRYLGPWHTDCVSTYLDSDTDMKVVLQDPDDAIIDNAASLKNGIATKLCASESLWWPRKPSNTGYRTAILKQEPPIFDEEVTREPLRLDNAFIEAVCVAVVALGQQTQAGSGAQSWGGQSYDEDDEDDEDDDNNSNGSSSANNNNNTNTNNNNNKNSTNGSYQATRGTNPGVGGGLSMRQYRPTAEWLRVFCTQSIAESNVGLSHLEKVFLVIASLDGRNGQLCGHALAGGYDNLFPFFCALVQWSSRSFGSSLTVSKSAGNAVRAVGRSIHAVCEDLDALQQRCPSFLSQDPVLLFLLKAMRFLREKMGHIEHAAAAHSTGSSEGTNGSGGSSDGLFSPPRSRGAPPTLSEGLPASVAVSSGIAEDRRRADARAGGRNQPQSAFPVNPAAVPSPAGQSSAGLVITVNCGHSGWPNKKALDALTSCVHQAGFSINSSDAA